MFSRKCVCKLNISKIVRPLLAALSDNGLTTGRSKSSLDVKENGDDGNNSKTIPCLLQLSAFLSWPASIYISVSSLEVTRESSSYPRPHLGSRSLPAE